MANNLFISYSLHERTRRDEAIVDCIHQLGDWARVTNRVWYVHSPFGAKEACERLWNAMSPADTLLVVDATNNESAWQNIDDDVGTFMRDHWHRYPKSSRDQQASANESGGSDSEEHGSDSLQP